MCTLTQTHPHPPTHTFTALLSSPPSNVWFHKLEHVERGLVESDKHAIVDLPQTKQVQDLPGPGMNTVDTAGGRGEEGDRGGKRECVRRWGSEGWKKFNDV